MNIEQQRDMCSQRIPESRFKGGARIRGLGEQEIAAFFSAGLQCKADRMRVDILPIGVEHAFLLSVINAPPRCMHLVDIAGNDQSPWARQRALKQLGNPIKQRCCRKISCLSVSICCELR